MVFDIIIFKRQGIKMRDKFFDIYTIGNIIIIFGLLSIMILVAFPFSYSGDQHILSSPLFIILSIIVALGILIMCMGHKYHD